MKSCIIGGSGFIGRHLITELASNGREVYTVSRGCLTDSGRFHCTVDSLFDPKINALLQSGMEEVTYLAYATTPKTSFDDPLRDIEENLAQAVHLFELVKQAKSVKKLVYVSSGGTVYGNTQDDKIREDHLKNPISPYGITKLTIEHFANMFFKIYHLPVIVVRPSNAYGIGQLGKAGQGFIAYAMQSILEGREINIFGQEGMIRDYIYVSDVASAIRFCLDKAHPGTIYNVGSQQGYSNMEIIRLLSGLIHEGEFTIQTKHLEARPFDVNKNILDTTAIRQATGWTARVSIMDGLAMTWDWFKNHKPAA